VVFGGGFGVVFGGGFGVVLVVVGGGALGHDSLTLTTPAGSFNVEGETPGGRWK
jgi:hypothetical protein